jgi:hypothetical protein
MNDPSEKGQELRLIRGSYKGKTAWVNPRKRPTKKRIYVIILMDDSMEKETFVSPSSVDRPLSPPKSYEEALLQQHPKITANMEDLAKQLAMCNIQAGNQNMHVIFDEMIGKYFKNQLDDNASINSSCA